MEYQYPEERGINPLKVQKENLKNLFMNSDSDLIRTLARSGLGGLYSEEIFLRSGVNKKIPATEVGEQEIEAIYQTIVKLFKPLKTFDFQPQIVKNDKEDVLPLNLKMYQDYEIRTFESYNQAADEFYSSKVGSDIKKVQEDVWQAEVGKYEKRLRIQEETLHKFRETVEESKKKGNLLYSHYSEVQNILDIIHNAREKYSWMEIAAKLKKARKEGLKDADIIESLDKMGVLNIKLEGEQVIVDSNLEIPENAENYYNRGKKAKRKIKGVNIAIEKTKKDLENVRGKREIALRKIQVPQKRVHRELKWFEKLRWFLSSDRLLVIAGRDAGTNELVVKRYLDAHDLYLHSDIHGAPSVVIKKFEGDIPESSINEAGIFAASFSSAWTKGFGSLDVYWVHPEQVSKTPQSGEFVTRGAFIIRGTRNYLRGMPLKIAVGIVDYEGDRIMAGPVEALAEYTDNYVVVKPGFTKKEVIAKEILKKIDPDRILTLEDVIRVLPSGKCDIMDNTI
jgi:predicted ribosome quality control (RQC) complex YloA/Tae2 family protein